MKFPANLGHNGYLSYKMGLIYVVNSSLLWIFQAIFETSAVTALSVVFVGKRLEWKSIFTIGFIIAVAMYLIRLLPLAFGIHLIIATVILAILLNMYQKIRFSRCLLAALAAVLFLAVFETIGVFLLSSITGISFEQVMEDSTLKSIFGLPHILLLFLLAMVLSRWHRGRRLKRGENHA
jgi:hypothetical protein